MPKELTVGQYLIERLWDLGVRHIFGIPGDYVLGFYDQLVRSKLTLINTCDEQGAGFAADAYARVHGFGVVCVTYCVGGLKLTNTTAEAFAEKSPVLIISGAPGLREREKNPLLHHKVREFDTQQKVFEQLTVASATLTDTQTAFREIDRVLEAILRYKRPGYIELPRDVITRPGGARPKPQPRPERTDPRILRAARDEAAKMIRAARRPVFLVDVEVHRFNLQEQLLRLIDKTGIPVAATILGKSVLGEQHPLYLGVYEGAMGREEVRRYVESSDCVIMLGVFMTDINLGIYTARLDPARSISATSEKLSIGYHAYEGVAFQDFMRSLLALPWRRRTVRSLPHPQPYAAVKLRGNRKLTVQRLFQQLNSFLDARTIVIADVGDSLFAATDLFIHRRTEFLAPAYYASMGFAIPAAIGAQLANPGRRPLVLVGDGAFLMTGLELATIARYKLNPIIVVLNNAGFGTERHIQDGPYNDVPAVQFHQMPALLNTGRSFLVQTEEQLSRALQEARRLTQSFCLIEVKLDPWDRSPAMDRLARRLAQRLHA